MGNFLAVGKASARLAKNVKARKAIHIQSRESAQGRQPWPGPHQKHSHKIRPRTVPIRGAGYAYRTMTQEKEMTIAEQEAAIREIYKITNDGVSLSFVQKKQKSLGYFFKWQKPGFWRCSYSINSKDFNSDAATPGAAISAALDHVRKELP